MMGGGTGKRGWGTRGKRGQAMGAPGRSEGEGVQRIRAGWGRNPGAREPQGYLPGQEWAVQPQKESGGVFPPAGGGKNVALGSFIGKIN